MKRITISLPNDLARELPFAALGRSGHRTTARDMGRLIEQEWNKSALGGR